MNKRGLELAINTIVIFVLAIAVLVALILIFNKGSAGFMEKVSLFFSPSNTDDFVKACNNFVVQEASNEYCCIKKTAKLSKQVKLELTCSNASTQAWGSDIEGLNCEGVC